MYNTEFICSYNLYNPVLNKANPIMNQYSDTIMGEFKFDTEAELQEMSEYVFQDELLSAFGIDDYDDKIIHDIITKLYDKIANFSDEDSVVIKRSEIMNQIPKFTEKSGLDIVLKTKFLECVHTLSNRYSTEDPLFGFTTLFSYDYFHLTHLCLCDLLNDGNFKELHIKALEKVVGI